MRGLAQLFAAYSNFLLFLILETLSLVLIVQFNHNQQAIWSNSVGLMTASVEQKVDNMTDYIGLREEVIKLQAENIALMQKLDRTEYALAIQRDTIGTDSLLDPAFTYIGANVISNSITTTTNSLRLDKGSQDSVYRNMGVITSDGIVGIVRTVSGRYCQVMSILHRESRIKASLHQSGYFGTLTWDGEDPKIVKLDAVPKHAIVEKGDTVVTSGYSQLFPEGIMIGTVHSAELPPGGNFHDIEVVLRNDLSRVQYVYLINNRHREELKELDQIAQ